ncbi:MAG: peptidoglycan -binding protein [Gammaproteobacteria bacterium]|jgi:chemotaxis protein MotB
MLVASRRRRATDIWPGFVDALSALLMVVIFLLLLFSVGQFLLTDALVGRDRALDILRTRIAELADVLSLERKEKAALESQVSSLSANLAAMTTERDEVSTRLQAMTARAEEADARARNLRSDLEAARARLSEAEQDLARQRRTVAELETARDELSGQRDELQRGLAASRQATEEQEQLTEKAQAQVNELEGQLAALNDQLAQLSAALEASESQVAEQKVVIEDLGRRLNVALAKKVEELARYRSEFFGKLREALKDNPDVRIEGDRFVLPSEVLFSSASAELDAEGRREIETVAEELAKITKQIPDDLDWVLRVDGHTDKRPIHRVFASNWELSSARATSIVKYLIDKGIPPENLVAAGFAQYHPIDPGDSEEAYRRNRRIELKLTSR